MNGPFTGVYRYLPEFTENLRANYFNITSPKFRDGSLSLAKHYDGLLCLEFYFVDFRRFWTIFLTQILTR